MSFSTRFVLVELEIFMKKTMQFTCSALFNLNCQYRENYLDLWNSRPNEYQCVKI